MTLKQFPQKRIMITGAGSGFGRALAVEFAKLGWRIAIAEIDPERMKRSAETIRALGGEALEILCDVTKPEDLLDSSELVKQAWGGLDILVNNAGVAGAGLIEKTEMETWDWIIALNTKSIIHGCRAFVPMFKEQGYGYIVNMASSAGIVSLPEMGCYNITKAAAISITETLRIELAPHNISVSVICPTFFKTNIMEQFKAPEERQLRMAQAFFSKTRYTPEHIASHVIKSINRRKFYILTQPDAKISWYIKRFFPEFYLRAVAFFYKRGLIDKYLGA